MFPHHPQDKTVDLIAYQQRFGVEGVQLLLRRREAALKMLHYRSLDVGGVCAYRATVAKQYGVTERTLYSYEEKYEEGGLPALMFSAVRKDKGNPRSLCLEAQFLAMHYKKTCPGISSPRILKKLKFLDTQRDQVYCINCCYAKDLPPDFPVCTLDKKGLLYSKHHSTITRFLNNPYNPFSDDSFYRSNAALHNKRSSAKPVKRR
jgi:predicted metal-binding protein